MHLPRMLEKLRRRAEGALEAYYEPTVGQGFDRMLAEHLGIPFSAFAEMYRTGQESEEEIDEYLAHLLRFPLMVPVWNRRLVQRGLSGYGKFRLDLRKQRLGLADVETIRTMADLIEYMEGRLTR